MAQIDVRIVAWAKLYPWATPLAWFSRTFGVPVPYWMLGRVEYNVAK